MKNILQTIQRLTIVISLLTITNAFAQVSEGGVPPSFSATNKVKTTLAPYTAALSVDVNKLLQEDVEEEALGYPMRVAETIPVELNTHQSGAWSTLEDGTRIWQLIVEAPGAKGLFLSYDTFYIPTGGKLFLYGTDQTSLIGAFTEKTNPAGKQFSTTLILGDRITLEYVEPKEPNPLDQPKLDISGIAYAYNHIDNSGASLRASAASCEININCADGALWQKEKKGVAKIVTQIGSGWYLCSGTLLNNTSEDLTPYFLSAYHCFNTSSTAATYSTMQYYFQYEFSGCDNTTLIPTAKTMVGAQLLVTIPINGGSDATLLKLANPIPLNYDIYYNGWDRTNTPATSGVGIHHPQGDVKKISTYLSPVTQMNWSGDGSTGAAGAHWNAIFNRGVTEGGSSGSPLFNQNKLVVGTLSGGSSDCSFQAGSNIYGKMWYHWDQHATQKMKPFLDPLSTNPLTLSGRYPTERYVDFSVEKEAAYTYNSVKYFNHSHGATTYDWELPGANPTTSTETEPTVIYKTAGTYGATLILNKGLPTEERMAKSTVILINPRSGQPIDGTLTANLVAGTPKTVQLDWSVIGGTTLRLESLDSPEVTLRSSAKELGWYSLAGGSYKTGSIGTSASTLFATQWVKDDLYPYNSMTLNSINFIPVSSAYSYIFYVWQGDFTKYVSSTLSSLTINKLYKHTLPVPLSVDLSKDLIIGYKTSSASALIAFDNGPLLTGKNLYRTTSTNPWSAAESIGGLGGNWILGASATVDAKASLFDVYRNGALIATALSQPTFVDTNIPDAASLCYTVRARFDDGVITDPMTPVCISSSGIAGVAVEPMSVFFNASSTQLVVQSTELIKSVTVTDLAGLLIDKQQASDPNELLIHAANWPQGVYLITVAGANQTRAFKVLKNVHGRP